MKANAFFWLSWTAETWLSTYIQAKDSYTYGKNKINLHKENMLLDSKLKASYHH